MPFNEHQFLEVFKNYNEAIWPVQVLTICLALMIVVAAMTKRGAYVWSVLPVLTAFWLVNGIGYHVLFFAEINPIAKIFGALFILQAVLFALLTFRYKGVFDALSHIKYRFGLLMTIYAIAVYPAWGLVARHGYPYSPMLGVSPCPTTIFTLGVMLMARPALPRWLFIIPMLWALIGMSAAMSLGIREDLGLTVSFLIVLGYLIAPTVKKFRHHVSPVGGQPA